MKKRILGLGLSLVMALSLLPFSALGADITFTDVPVNAWYYNDVKRSVELNLVNGIGNNKFDPTGKLTYGAAVKLAACIHQQKTQGSVTLKNGSPWYQSYVDYCKSKGIITKDYNWNANATRAGYMEIFESVLPASPNDEINYVPYDSIPDVPADHPQRYSIYRLYRLGVVQGGDAQFNCSPNSDISRSEVATILVRMMDPTARKRFNTRTPLNIAKDIPTSVTVTRGQPVTLTTEACGGVTPYQYEWEYWNSRGQYYSFGGRTCFGPTVELYATEYGLDMNGHCVVSYSGWEKDIRVQCRVFDSQGSYVTTSAAVLKITDSASTTPLTISQQPNDCTITAGSTASFYASAKNGESPYTFQWYLANGTKLTDGNGYSGTNTAVLTRANTPANATGTGYYCVITDQAGATVTTRKATLTVTAATAALKVTNPVGVTTTEGGTATFSVTASGGKAPYSYAWRLHTANGDTYVTNPSDNGKNATYTMPGVRLSDNGEQYYCVVTDANGATFTTGTATLTVTAASAATTLKVTTPVSATATEGGSATFSVTASGGKAPYSYAWRVHTADGDAYVSNTGDNGKNATYTEPYVRLSDNGRQYYCEVRDANGNIATSGYATLTVKAAPATTLKVTTPASVTTTEGGSATFSVTASGGKAPYSYAWRIHTSSVDGYISNDSDNGTNATYTEAYVPLSANGRQYYCEVRDANGNTATSGYATLTVKAAPVAPLSITK